MSRRLRPGPVGTRRLLLIQSAALVLLTLLTTLALFGAHQDVHHRPAQVRDRTAPAVLEVAAARAALMNAHLAAARGLRSGVSDVIGPGEDYRAHIASANQSLSRTADRQVAGEYGVQRLSIINALLLAYTERVAEAARHDNAGSPHGAQFLSADAILNRGGTGILSRLDELQAAQREVLSRQTSAGGSRWARWLPAGAAFLVLVAALAVTQWQLSRRFPQRLNPALLAAGALLLAGWAVVPLADATQQRLDAAREDLLGVVDQQWGAVADGTLTEARVTATRELMTEVRTDVNAGMHDSDWRARVGVAVPLGGLLTAGLIAAGLQRHLAQYRIRR